MYYPLPNLGALFTRINRFLDTIRIYLFLCKLLDLEEGSTRTTLIVTRVLLLSFILIRICLFLCKLLDLEEGSTRTTLKFHLS